MISSKIFLGRPYHLFSLSNNIEPDALSCIFKAPEEVIKPTALFVVGGMVGRSHGSLTRAEFYTP